MKKLIVLLVCALLVNVLVVGIGHTGVAVDASEITTPAKYHWSFDDATGLTAVRQVGKAANSINDGATYDITESKDEFVFSNGPVGQCLYLDGNYGVKLDIESLDTDAYSISFWINARKLNTYGPTLTLGRNMGDSGNDRTVTWFNFTQAEWGTNGHKLFPVAWNRNSSTGVWPWISAGDDKVHGLREWVMVTLVTDGQKYTCADDNMDRIGTKLYLDGKLVFDASAANGFYQGVSPEILTGDGIEAYIGVNYWDPNFRGFIDELYIFDYSLTDAQVESLFAEGDKSVDSYCPDAENDLPFQIPEITVDENAIDYINTTDRNALWWTDWSNSYKLEDGQTATVKFNNYSNAELNWNNYVVAFTNKPTVGHIAPNEQYPGYMEYGVLRADAWGWGDGAYNAQYDINWTGWATWRQRMADAEVTLKITRNGNKIRVESIMKGGENNDTRRSVSTFTSTLTADSPCYFFLTGEGCYLELLSVKGATLPTAEDIEEASKTEEKVVASALDYVGTPDLNLAWWTDWSDAYKLEDGGKVTFKFNNYSNCIQNWNNYVVGFVNNPTVGHVAPNTQFADYAEYGVVRSDAYGWGYQSAAYETSWGADWDLFRNLMAESKVTLEITRNGSTAVIDATIVGADGTVLTSKGTIELTMDAAGDCYVFLTGEGCYLELTAVKNSKAKADEPIDTVGAADKSTGWWGDWSDSYELANGNTVTVKFNNFGGGANWNNYVLALVNVPVVGHSAPADQFPGEYAEYGVVRADVYGWGYQSASFEASWDTYYEDDNYDEWDKFRALMAEAEVTLAVTRSNGEVTIDGTYVGADNTVMTQKAVINTTMTSDSDCYFFLTVDGSHIEIISVETAAAGAVEEAVATAVSETDIVLEAVVSETDVVSEADVVSETDAVSEADVVEVAPVVTETDAVEVEVEEVVVSGADA